MRTFILVVFWLELIGMILKGVTIIGDDYPRRVKRSSDIVGMILAMGFVLWCGIVLWN